MPRRPVFKIIRKDQSMFNQGLKYTLDYTEGKVTKALRGTLGIFCFLRKKDAERFLTPFYGREIKRVIPIGRGKVPKEILGIGWLSEFYKDPKNVGTASPPKGTICYLAVKVLKEVK